MTDIPDLRDRLERVERIQEREGCAMTVGVWPHELRAILDELAELRLIKEES